MTNSFRKNDNYLKIRLLAKIRLLGRNSKIRSGEDTLGYLEVLHAKFRDAPTNSKKSLFLKKIWVSRSKPKYFLVLFTYYTVRESARDNACRFLRRCDK